jgi:methylphosphotriester-DNA--protein-cysteine methyltransferase
MRSAFAFLAAAAVLGAVPGPARASDVDWEHVKSDIEHAKSDREWKKTNNEFDQQDRIRENKRSWSDAESKRWEGEKKAKRAASHHDGDTHYAEPFVGNSDTMKVHLQECEWAEKTAESNRAYFKTYEEAATKGYAACKVCKPDSATPGVAAPAGAAIASPQPQAAPSPAGGAPSGTPPARASTPFVGHRITRKLHRASCEWGKKISDANRVGFATWKEAQVAGYVACGKCKPDVGQEGGSAEALEMPFIGSRSSKKFHRAGCEFAQKISPDNRVGFKSREEAAAAGFTACGKCKPDAAETPAAGTK